ncbi:MAG: site-specific integrase [Candidatus Zixiibacteriota bacterium]
MAKGSVIKRSGSWYAVYRDGSRQKWEKVGTSKRTAEKVLAERLDQLNSGGYQELTQIRFREFAEKWLKDYAEVNTKPSTYHSYVGVIQLHLNPYLGDRWLHKITAGHIQEIVSTKISDHGLSPKSVGNVLVVLKRMFQHAVLWGYLRRNPAALVQKPRVERQEMDILNPEEVRIFLQHVRAKHYALFLTAVLTGMRRGELLALQWGDIDWRSSQIIVRRSLYKGQFTSPKTKYSCRRIVMSKTLQEALQQHRLISIRSEDDLIFCNENGKPLDPDDLVKREFFPALDRAGLHRIRFHDLRHTYASLLIAQGENIKFIQHQLGHASATTTLDRYGHLMSDRNVEAAERLDQTVFGGFVRKLLENPESEGIPQKHELPEVFPLQGVKLGSGGRI